MLSNGRHYLAIPGPSVMPDRVLAADPELSEAVAALTPGRQRSYVLNLAEAKAAATKGAGLRSFGGIFWRGRGLWSGEGYWLVRSRTLRLAWVVVSGFGIGVSQILAAQEIPLVRFNIGCSSGTCLVSPWDAPAQPEDFRHNGVAFESNTEILPIAEQAGYRAALEKFRSAESCLSNEAMADDGFDLGLIDWASLGTLTEIEVCLARIHNSIRNSDNSVFWFHFVGFSGQARVRPKDHFQEGWTDIYGSWTGEGTAPFRWQVAFFPRLRTH